MHRTPLVLGLAAVFTGLTALLAIGGVVSGEPVPVLVAVPFGVTSYVMFYHGSGRLARSVARGDAARRVRRDRGGFGAGPRRTGRARTRAAREARTDGFGLGERFGIGGSANRSTAGGRATRPPRRGPSRAEAREVLGVGVSAEPATIKRAYRERVKEVHPDRGGDEDQFKRVRAAYDRLRE